MWSQRFSSWLPLFLLCLSSPTNFLPQTFSSMLKNYLKIGSEVQHFRELPLPNSGQSLTRGLRGVSPEWHILPGHVVWMLWTRSASASPCVGATVPVWSLCPRGLCGHSFPSPWCPGPCLFIQLFIMVSPVLGTFLFVTVHLISFGSNNHHVT